MSVFFMTDVQLEIPETKKQSPESLVRETLERAIIRHRGDIRAYQEELLKKIPETASPSFLDDLMPTFGLRRH